MGARHGDSAVALDSTAHNACVKKGTTHRTRHTHERCTSAQHHSTREFTHSLTHVKHGATRSTAQCAQKRLRARSTLALQQRLQGLTARLCGPCTSLAAPSATPSPTLPSKATLACTWSFQEAAGGYSGGCACRAYAACGCYVFMVATLGIHLSCRFQTYKSEVSLQGTEITNTPACVCVRCGTLPSVLNAVVSWVQPVPRCPECSLSFPGSSFTKNEHVEVRTSTRRMSTLRSELQRGRRWSPSFSVDDLICSFCGLRGPSFSVDDLLSRG